ncbi:MAG: hypothetical protein RL172_1225 [Bacteroidota bacterium]|jgi:beta-alanine degradation protein BauB
MITRILFATACCIASACNNSTQPSAQQKAGTANDTVSHKPATGHSTALNIDGLKVSPNNFKLLLENEYVRVLEYTLKPGQKDSAHTHPAKSSYVVSGGKIKVYLANGQSLIFDEKAGTADWSNYIGKHYVENIGSTTVTILLTEIKSIK